jgi:murein hydrolase activator
MNRILILFCLVLISEGLLAQTRKELEEQRKKTLEEINYVDNMIKDTEKEKSTSLNQLKIVGNRLVLRENVISGMTQEIDLLNDRINLNKLAIVMMEEDLVKLRKDYARLIVSSYRTSKGNTELWFILSSKDFNQGYKRMKYLQQLSSYRRQETETIQELAVQIEISKRTLQNDLDNLSDLKDKEEKQKSILQQEQSKRKRMVNSLTNKEKQLKKDLEDKKKVIQRIDDEISRIIEEEKKKKTSGVMTPEQKLIGDNFSENKGRLPWPVEKGIITGQFGEQQHQVLAYVKEKNIGIEITSTGKTPVRAVFKGQVMRVFPIPGANIAIIIRHGKYLSVYQNLVNVKVKQGDQVDTKQEIGDVFSDPDNGSKSILYFMIFDEKYLDPEQWIAKRK